MDKIKDIFFFLVPTWKKGESLNFLGKKLHGSLLSLIKVRMEGNQEMQGDLPNNFHGKSKCTFMQMTR